MIRFSIANVGFFPARIVILFAQPDERWLHLLDVWLCEARLLVVGH